MPWNNQGGGWQGGGGRGPWGQGPRGGGGPQPPNLEELLRRGQERFRNLMPGGFWGSRGITLVIAVLLTIWMASGIYTVLPDEQGVVLRFGRWVQTTQPGLNYHLPYPIETVMTPKVTRVNRTDIGFQSVNTERGGGIRDIPHESLMLTGDENIVDIDFSVQWVIKDAGETLFNIKDPSPYMFDIEGPQATVKAVAESAMREVIGHNQIQRILTEGRQPVEEATQRLMQEVLDSYKAGIQITQVNLQKVDPPAAVIDAFRDVQAAKADRDRAQNEAEAYRNDIIPRARGDAEKIVQGAQAYKQQTIAQAQGEAARFQSVLNAYRQAKEVTARRLYLETMEQVLHGINKVVIDPPPGSPGIVPYLPLPDMLKKPGAAQ